MLKSPIESKLDAEIISALEELEHLEKASEDYGTIVERMSKLHKLKSEESDRSHKIKSDSKIKPPSLDTVLAVGANIFGILWLTRYERENVIKSKAALGFVMKPRA